MIKEWSILASQSRALPKSWVDEFDGKRSYEISLLLTRDLLVDCNLNTTFSTNIFQSSVSVLHMLPITYWSQPITSCLLPVSYWLTKKILVKPVSMALFYW